jgi:thiol-disulfide isomerase/thioredoxin
MRDWYKLQYVASARAKRFQVAAAKVRREMPALDFSVRRSPTLVGSLTEAKARMTLRKEIVPFMRERMGLVLFYSPTCRYCAKQMEILEGFSRKWDWTNIRLIDAKANHDIADRFGVQLTPDLWILGNMLDGDDSGENVLSMRIKTGLATISEIEDGLMRAYYEWFEGKNYERPEMVEELVKPEEVIKQLQLQQQKQQQ